MGKYDIDYDFECAKCPKTYISDFRWYFCPVCGSELKVLSAKRCQPIPKGATASERVYTVEEVAEMMGFSRDTVTRLFQNEPGVLILNRPTKMNKRRYRNIRIPHSVYERVRRRLEI